MNFTLKLTADDDISLLDRDTLAPILTHWARQQNIVLPPLPSPLSSGVVLNLGMHTESCDPLPIMASLTEKLYERSINIEIMLENLSS
jgi:hypothetical protein